MTISIELRTHILRLYQAEHWRVGTIARQLHLHRDTVTRVLAGASVVVVSVRPRARQIDLYLPFIHETLTKYPRLTELIGVRFQLFVPNKYEETPHFPVRQQSPLILFFR